MAKKYRNWCTWNFILKIYPLGVRYDLQSFFSHSNYSYGSFSLTPLKSRSGSNQIILLALKILAVNRYRLLLKVKETVLNINLKKFNYFYYLSFLYILFEVQASITFWFQLNVFMSIKRGYSLMWNTLVKCVLFL